MQDELEVTGTAAAEATPPAAPAVEEFEVGAPVETDPVKQAEVKASREDKKRERKTMLDELKALRETTERQSRKLEELASRPAVAPVQQQTQDADPDEVELGRIYAEQKSMLIEFNSLGDKVTPAQLDGYEKRARQIEERKYTAIAQKAMRQAGVGPAPTPQDHAAAMLQTKYPDVMNHPSARSWSRGRYEQLRAEGRPEGMDLAEEVLHAARVQFGMAPRQAPTAVERSRFASVGRSSGSSAAASSFQMTDDTKRLADKFAPHIKDDNARYQHWVNLCAKEHMELKRKLG